jgi:hypothetical protein
MPRSPAVGPRVTRSGSGRSSRPGTTPRPARRVRLSCAGLEVCRLADRRRPATRRGTGHVAIAAQGGINAAENYRNDGDSVFRLFYDTVKGGDFRAREAKAYRLAQVSVNIIDQCAAQGGAPSTRRVGSIRSSRILPCEAPGTTDGDVGATPWLGCIGRNGTYSTDGRPFPPCG